MPRIAFLLPRLVTVTVGTVCVVVLVATLGCKRSGEISSYDLPIPPPPKPTHRMLAALAPDEINPELLKTLREQARSASKQRGEEADDEAIPDQVAWFFKLVGPVDAVEAVADQFDSFVRSLELRGGPRPSWTLPDGWHEDRTVRVEGRDATIRTGQASDALELTISRMAVPKDLEARLVLNNINRWRKQMNLHPIPYSEFDKETRTVEIADGKAIVVDLKGVFAGAGMSQLARSATASDPHANLPAASRAAVSAGASASTDEQRPITFEKPEPWKEGRSGGFRVAAFEIIGEGGQKAEVTVIPLGAEAGDLKSNADRWAGEIKRPPFESIDEVRERLKTIRVDGIESEMLHLTSPSDIDPQQATIGVITRRADRVWFFKLRGTASLVEQEKEHFEEFVKSVKFK